MEFKLTEAGERFLIHNNGKILEDSEGRRIIKIDTSSIPRSAVVRNNEIYIETNNIDELLELSKEVDCALIIAPSSLKGSPFEGIPEIEVYNGYRE